MFLHLHCVLPDLQGTELVTQEVVTGVRGRGGGQQEQGLAGGGQEQEQGAGAKEQEEQVHLCTFDKR